MCQWGAMDHHGGGFDLCRGRSGDVVGRAP